MATWSRGIFSKNLQHFMEQKGITQRELAEIIGVSAPTLNEWIKAKKYPRIDKVEKLANYFGCLKSDLIEDQREMQKKNDILSDIILKMRTDSTFLSVVENLHTLDKDKLETINQMLNTLFK